MISFILASGSPRRKALLTALGMNVDVIVSEVEERLEGSPQDAALANARNKGVDVASRVAGPAIVIAADTIVVLGDQILGKPADAEEARAMVRLLSGRRHQVMTAVWVVDTGTGKSAEDIETTDVVFRELDEHQIDVFVRAVNPVDRAGAYTVDGPGSLLVERYNGCYQNVLGLPMVLVDRLLGAIGHDLFSRIDGSRAVFL